jgi:formate-dependent nitrite reductase membrane component NrfD
VLKPPVWTWEIPAYFFVGGVAGVAAVISGIGSLAGADAGLVRDARWVAAAGALISPALLISDLGRPGRFLNMLRVFKRRSAMSVGVWTLVAFSAVVFMSIALRLMDPAAPRVMTAVLDAGCVLTGLVLSTYTGVLIGATSVPVWAKNAALLPLHFGASSLGAGAATIELIGHHTAALNAMATAASIIETVVAARAPAALFQADAWQATPAILAGTFLTGPIALVLRLWGLTSPTARMAAGVAAIAGSMCSRYGWLAAGRQSAREA